jgi:hypothetical protein
LVEGLGLLLQGGGQGAFSQTRRSGAGALLHHVEVHIEAGAVGAEGAFGDDFTPAGGEVTNLLEHLGSELAARHGLSCLVLAQTVRPKVLQPLYDPALSAAKLLMASVSLTGSN